MPANTSPIFSLAWATVPGGAIIGSAANTATDGTGANSSLIFTAGAEGSFITKVYLRPVSTIAATVARLWLCSDIGAFTPGTTNTAANSSNLGEITVAAWTVSNSISSVPYEIPVMAGIKASHKLFMTFGTSTGAGTTGFSVTTFAGNY